MNAERMVKMVKQNASGAVFRLRAYDGCDQSTEDAYSFAVPNPASGVSRGLYKPDLHSGLFHVPELGTDFDYGFFRSPNLDTLNLTTDI
jgi:hypothetical protein